MLLPRRLGFWTSGQFEWTVHKALLLVLTTLLTVTTATVPAAAGPQTVPVRSTAGVRPYFPAVNIARLHALMS